MVIRLAPAGSVAAVLLWASTPGPEILSLVCHSEAMWWGETSESFVTDYVVEVAGSKATVAGSDCRRAPETTPETLVLACTNPVLEASNLYDLYRIELVSGRFRRDIMSGHRVVATVVGRCAAPDL
jgi:hypothetical protein